MADNEEQKKMYDAACKNVLSEKWIIANILKGCVSEFKECSIEDIVNKYLQGTPEVGSVRVEPDIFPKIENQHTEDKSESEGTIFFDVRFTALAPSNGELIELIINIEAQNKFNPGYSLLKRAIYYCSRMISSQYGTVFTRAQYDKIKKVYSIWVCTAPTKAYAYTISKFAMQKEDIIGETHPKREDYDLLTPIFVCLGDKSYKNVQDNLLSMLNLVLLDNMSSDEKIRELTDRFSVKLTPHLEKGVKEMCNLSEGIEARGIAIGERRGEARGEKRGEKRGRENERMNSIRAIMRNAGVTAEKAMELLGIEKSLWKKYLTML